MTNSLPIIQNKPLEKPPEDELERIAFQTLCVNCENFLTIRNKYYSYTDPITLYPIYNVTTDYKCKNPHDGKIDIIENYSVNDVYTLNPSGYGCPTFKPKKVGSKLSIKKYSKGILYILSLWGIIDIISAVL